MIDSHINGKGMKERNKIRYGFLNEVVKVNSFID
jgi:hypothetical protein